MHGAPKHVDPELAKRVVDLLNKQEPGSPWEAREVGKEVEPADVVDSPSSFVEILKERRRKEREDAEKGDE